METWKSVERALASRLGGVRNPISGRQRGDKADIEHPTLSLEIKHRKKLPDWIWDALDQAEKSKKNGQTPVVILHENKKHHDNDVVVLKFSDFILFLGLNEDKD